LILSPQNWGTMFLSKQHYAIELAKRGNAVYFLNPPEQSGNKKNKSIDILTSGIDNLWLINHRLAFPYRLKFHAISLFHFLMGFHIKRMVKAIKKPIDIVWSFDLGNIYPFDSFDKSAIKIFHPVDEPLNQVAFDSAKGCDIIFSVTNEILEKYKDAPAPRYFINHGVSDDFFIPFSNDGKILGNKKHVGLSGNLLRQDLDRETLIAIVQQNPDFHFDFFGSYKPSQSNIGGSQDLELFSFIETLRASGNVTLHGPLAPEVLAQKLQSMDAFLICYDIKKDQSKGTNYHKIMEYLSTGKVIISNNVTTYQNQENLIRMSGSRSDNKELPWIFKETMNNLDKFNSEGMQMERISFAKKNTYSEQLKRIEQLISEKRD
jgi:hypothetical protein